MAREEINVEQLLRKRKAFNQNAFDKLKDAKAESRNIFNQYFFQDKGREHPVLLKLLRHIFRQVFPMGYDALVGLVPGPVVTFPYFQSIPWPS